MTDGSAVGEPDTFLGNWVIRPGGNISIYTTGGQNLQQVGGPNPDRPRGRCATG